MCAPGIKAIVVGLHAHAGMFLASWAVEYDLHPKAVVPITKGCDLDRDGFAYGGCCRAAAAEHHR